MTLNTLRAKRRTGDDGDSRDSASKSDAELTNGIGFVITREGYFLDRRLMKDCAAGIGKIFVGHANALAILSMSLGTVSSWDGRNGNMQKSASSAIAESKAGRFPPPSMISHPSGVLWLAFRMFANSFGFLPSSTS
jgi:hypothetical protein